MNEKRRLLEEYFRFRVKPNPEPYNHGVNAKKSDQLNTKISQSIERSSSFSINELNTIRTMTNDRESQYKIYDDMESDSTISSALDMYADDSTQYNTAGRRLWVETKDDESGNIQSSIEYFIRLFRFEDDCWDHIRSLCKYGDLYLRLFREKDNIIHESGSIEVHDSESSGNLEEYIEAVDDPSVVFDLTDRNKTVGYILSVPSTNTQSNPQSLYMMNDSNKFQFFNPDRFVHIMLRRSTTRYPEMITMKIKDHPEDDNFTEKDYKIKRGKSVLHDIYKSYQELSLLEDSMLLNRLNKSSIVRLLQVEVGDTPKGQVTMIMRRLKEMLEQKMVINKDSHQVKSVSNSGPLENIVYIPTRNGKGAVSAQTLGGDVDVKSLVDISYYSDKVFGGLKIPKAFLGITESEGLGSSSLDKKDSRYARTIKSIQSAYISGIEIAINLMLIDRNLEGYIGKYTLKMVSPSTIETQEREESFQTKLDTSSKLIDLVKSASEDNSATEVLVWLLSNYAGDFKDIGGIILKNLARGNSNEDQSDEDDDFEITDGSNDDITDEMNNDNSSELSPEESKSIEDFTKDIDLSDL